MKCPVDHTSLRELKRGDFTLTSCGSCSGIWLTRDTLKQAFATRHPPEHLDESETQPPLLKPAKGRSCPSCHHPLAVRWLHGIEIDVCQKCQGVWLDAGELRQIVANYRQRKVALVGAGSVPMVEAAADNRQSRWYDGIDFPCDIDFLTPLGESLGELASSGVDALPAVAEFLGEALSLLDW